MIIMMMDKTTTKKTKISTTRTQIVEMTMIMRKTRISIIVRGEPTRKTHLVKKSRKLPRGETEVPNIWPVDIGIPK